MKLRSGAPLLLKALSWSFFRKKKDFKEADKKVIFIISTGRTGTKYLAELLNSQPGITALHEPKPSRILRMWSFAYIDSRVTKAWMKSILYIKRRKIMKNINNPIYIESNPYLIGFTDVLGEVFKDPILIHVVRDPRDFVRSAMNHGNSSGIKLFFNNYVPYWYPNINKFLKIEKKLSMTQKAAGYWCLANERLSSAPLKTSNYYQIRFEDLFSKPEKMQELSKIVGIKKIEVSSKYSKPINKSRKSDSQSWSKWSVDEAKFLDKKCGPLMRKLGYGKENSWLLKINA